MTLGKYLRLLLTTSPTVAAIVKDRVYSDLLPQKPAMPAIVFEVVGGQGDETLEGPSSTRQRRVWIHSWSLTREEASSLALVAAAALLGHSGAAAGFVVQGVFAGGEDWLYDDKAKLFKTIRDFEVWTSGDES